MDKFLDFIDRQRTKSEASRQRTAFATALGATALIAIVWFGAFNPLQTKTEAVAEVAAPSPLAAIFDLGRNFATEVSSLWLIPTAETK